MFEEIRELDDLKNEAMRQRRNLKAWIERDCIEEVVRISTKFPLLYVQSPLPDDLEASTRDCEDRAAEMLSWDGFGLSDLPTVKLIERRVSLSPRHLATVENNVKEFNERIAARIQILAEPDLDPMLRQHLNANLERMEALRARVSEATLRLEEAKRLKDRWDWIVAGEDLELTTGVLSFKERIDEVITGVIRRLWFDLEDLGYPRDGKNMFSRRGTFIDLMLHAFFPIDWDEPTENSWKKVNNRLERIRRKGRLVRKPRPRIVASESSTRREP